MESAHFVTFRISRGLHLLDTDFYTMLHDTVAERQLSDSMLR